MNTVLNTLEKARKLLVEQGWCQKMLAKNKKNVYVSFLSPDAEKFCAMGAITKACYVKGSEKINYKLQDACLEVLEKDLPENNIVRYNDSLPKKTGKRSIVRLFGRVINRLLKEGN